MTVASPLFLCISVEYQRLKKKHMYSIDHPMEIKMQVFNTNELKFLLHSDFIYIYQGLKLTFQPVSQAALIDCNFYQSAEKLIKKKIIKKKKK
jgi:hypothetical protein